MYLFVLYVLNERAGVSIPRQANDGTFLPSARDISLAVHKDVDNPHLHLTAMAAIWGQLVHNDISHTPQMAGELFSLLVCIGEPPCVLRGYSDIYPQPPSFSLSLFLLLFFFLFFQLRHEQYIYVVRVCLGNFLFVSWKDWPPLTCAYCPSLLELFSQRQTTRNSFCVLLFGFFSVRLSGSTPQVLRREFARISSRMLPNPTSRLGSCQRTNQHQMPRVCQIRNGP